MPPSSAKGRAAPAGSRPSSALFAEASACGGGLGIRLRHSRGPQLRKHPQASAAFMAEAVSLPAKRGTEETFAIVLARGGSRVGNRAVRRRCVHCLQRAERARQLQQRTPSPRSPEAAESDVPLRRGAIPDALCGGVILWRRPSSFKESPRLRIACGTFLARCGGRTRRRYRRHRSRCRFGRRSVRIKESETWRNTEPCA